MRWRRLFSKRGIALSLGFIAVLVVLFYPTWEYRTEVDVVNLRFREVARTPTWLFNWTLRERFSTPFDLPAGVKLRELGVLGPVDEDASIWQLNKGLRPDVRGWSGGGKSCLRAIGAVTALTPIPYPAQEEISKNRWVSWAMKDPVSAKAFWLKYQSLARKSRDGTSYLEFAARYLDMHPRTIDVAELDREFAEYNKF